MDKYGYIGIETLLNFCENSKDHAVTPNDFMRMKRVKEPERKIGHWIICSDGYYPYCSECKHRQQSGIMTKYCPDCGAKME